MVPILSRKWIFFASLVLMAILFFHVYSTVFRRSVRSSSESSLTKRTFLRSNETTEISGIACRDKDPTFRMELRGNRFWILSNYVKAEKTFSCDQSITFTTTCDASLLDNLVPLVERWNGPISVAVYAPGSDFVTALREIYYYRECVISSPLIKERVTFHLVFDSNHLPPSTEIDDSYFYHRDDSRRYYQGTCTDKESIVTARYKEERKLDFPINVLRNVARKESTTYYVFATDIELYPSPGLIPKFLDMIRRNDDDILRTSSNPKIFVNPIFEIRANHSLPRSKRELLPLLSQKIVIPFHTYVCSECHAIPKYDEWQTAPIKDGMNIFHLAKRTGKYRNWEPIFIGTNEDPIYDERLTWDGRGDKMTQAYQLCKLDYDLLILDNAFLIHRPGIKYHSKSSATKVNKQQTVKAQIMKELNQFYGNRIQC